MPRVVGIRFKPASKVYYFAPTGFEDLKVGDWVIVETTRGREAGRVVIVPKEVPKDEVVGQLKGILRRVTAQDMAQSAYFRHLEPEALEKCREMVTEHGLPMKVVKAEYNFDGSHLVFYFTAEKRVDFRELLRKLVKAFKTKIELRQIGVRDEAKLFGGLGRCGRPICCHSFLSEFAPISIKMAKLQDLPLSPEEISGICGRLLCCLAYEHEYYAEAKEKLPKVGEKVHTPHGPGKVIGVNVLKETVTVELESDVTLEFPADKVGRG